MSPLIGVGGPARRAADPEEALIARLSALAPALDGAPDLDWQARTRARLVAMAAVRTPERESVPPLRRLLARRDGPRGVRRTRLTGGVAWVAAAVTALATVVTLSADARPGDYLYGFKRGTEQTQLALAGDARGRTLLGLASTRLEELGLVLPDGPTADLVGDTLATMDEQTADGAAWLAERALDTGSSAPLDELAGWSAGQSAGLDGLRADVPAGAQDDAADSAALLARIGERVDELRISLGCPTGAVAGGSDELGPVPVRCAVSPAPPVGGGGEPGAPVADQPGTPAAPTPGASSPGTTGPGGGTVSGEPEGSGGGRDDDPGSGTDRGDGVPDLPALDPTTPDGPGTADLPAPQLPAVPPDPEGFVRAPAPGSAGSPTEGSSPGTVTPPDLGVCRPPLPVAGDC